jgi:hypothetical protein
MRYANHQNKWYITVLAALSASAILGCQNPTEVHRAVDRYEPEQELCGYRLQELPTGAEIPKDVCDTTRARNEHVIELRTAE